jgi:hypothetical protein
MGLPYDADRYQRALTVCALDRDLETLRPLRDLTLLGERGVNLSGGPLPCTAGSADNLPGSPTIPHFSLGGSVSFGDSALVWEKPHSHRGGEHDSEQLGLWGARRLTVAA